MSWYVHSISISYFYYYGKIDSTSLAIRKLQIKTRFSILKWKKFIKGLLAANVGKNAISGKTLGSAPSDGN